MLLLPYFFSNDNKDKHNDNHDRDAGDIVLTVSCFNSEECGHCVKVFIYIPLTRSNYPYTLHY